MEQLGTLYHWSPVSNRRSIERDGLVPRSSATVASIPLPYVCLGPSPSTSWVISGDMGWVSEIEEWDLWEIQIPKDVSLEVHVRAMYGPQVEEVKVFGVIPPQWMWHAGTRRLPVCD